ncbi:conjugal transfer protein [Pseudomonas sp. BRG-100]|uniref:type IV secretion system protein n=1 Tax=Pseudomonas sp. BRG-100 TaxID=1524267 RepID=UPI0004E6F9A4|nr:type IV secretion system protein [Pseudomonas sp. BRG-100]KFF42180.1 conjugal transfer protein [Pseudomonas sp. BRG-100]
MDFTNIAHTLFQSVDAALKSTLVTGTAKVILGLGVLFGTMWLIHFTLRNIQWLYRGMNVAFEEVVREIAKMAFIAFCAFNVTWYIQTIVPFVTGLPNWMGGILSGQEGGQTNQLDTMILAYIENLKNLTAAMSFNIVTTSFADIWLGIQGVVFYLLAGIPFILTAVGTLFVLKVSTTVLLAVGPIFIAFLFFDQTRQWFWGWVSAIGGFMLTQVLFAVILAMEIGFINTVIIKNGVINTSLAGNIAMLLIFATFTLLATELPGYAASIMGGAPTGGARGLGGIIGKVSGVGAAKKMAGGVAKLLAKRGNRIK